MSSRFKPSHISTFQIITLGFLGVILLGTVLLMLPFATKDGNGASCSDALFTATSAACVTGLVVQDTASYWSGFGQGVILMLIQVGGMGVVTVALCISLLSGRRISLMQRSTMQEAIAAPRIGGIVSMTGFILRGVLLFELLGAAALSIVFCREFGFWRGLWYSLFHSVSAFCNAGFDLMGIKGEFSSLSSYSGAPLVNLVVILLLVIGGIGFFTWEDIVTNRWRLQRYRLQSKVILLTSVLLILLPATFFYFREYSCIAGQERFWLALFQSATARTAGFNTADLTAMSPVGRALMMVLMLIGGSPGSTAGGMKTTTAAVLLASAVSVFRRKENAHMFRRRIADATVKNAAAILLLYVTLFIAGGMIISSVEGVSLSSSLFETASAIGTVGLSLGLTPRLGDLSRLILILLMYVGRVGGLTLIFAAVSGRNANVSKYPQENIIVG